MADGDRSAIRFWVEVQPLMARVDEERLLDCEVTLIFIACNVGEARRAEEVLTQSGVDYCLSFEPFMRTSIFAALTGATKLVGVGFSVISGQASFCRDILRRHGLRTGIIEDEP